MTRVLAWATACVLLLTILPQTAAVHAAPAAPMLRVVARAGTSAPGTSSNFGGFSAPVINELGQTAFRASLGFGSAAQSQNTGIWSEGGGTLSLVAREGSGAAGAGLFQDMLQGVPPLVTLNDSGQVAFNAQTSTKFSGLWTQKPGELLTLVAANGLDAPGTALKFGGLGAPELNNDGLMVFRGSVATGLFSTNSALWRFTPGGVLSLIGITGTSAPGGGSFTSFTGGLAVNAAGEVAFDASLSTPVTSDGVWRIGAGGAMSVVVRRGDEAPGTSERFDRLWLSDMNDAGRTVFGGTLTGPNVTSLNNRGLWRERDGVIQLLLREGEPAPGTDRVFGEVGIALLNNQGHAAVRGYVTSPGSEAGDYSGLWSDVGGQGLKLIAREGDTAPGTTAQFGPLSDYQESTALNARGQLAFRATLSGPAVDFRNDNGIWAHDRSGVLRLILREGDVLDISGDPLAPALRIVESFTFLGGAGYLDGHSTGFNDQGQVVADVRFTNFESAVIVFNAATIPEPTAAALAAVGVLGLGRLRRRVWQ
jgi:hypothetical protein